MAPKISWRRYGTKLRQCHPTHKSRTPAEQCQTLRSRLLWNGLASTSIRNAELSLNSFRRELKTLYCRRAYQRDRASLRQSAAIRARRHQISFPNWNGLNSSRPRFAPAWNARRHSVAPHSCREWRHRRTGSRSPRLVLDAAVNAHQVLCGRGLRQQRL